jgi:alpha-L-fucosidase
MANDGDFDTSWCLEDGETEGWIEVRWPRKTAFNTAAIVEPTSRIQSYRIERWTGSEWEELARGTSALPVRMHQFERTETDRVRISIDASRGTPHLAEIGFYDEPDR